MYNALGRFSAATGSLLALAPGAVWAQGRPEVDRYGYGPQMMWWDGGYGMIFGPLFMILVLAIVIALVVLLVRWIGGPAAAVVTPHNALSGRTPLDILKERFARGEIDKDEFESRRRVLGE